MVLIISFAAFLKAAKLAPLVEKAFFNERSSSF